MGPPSNNQRISDISAAAFAAHAAANPVILLPLGSQESHGPLSPMGDFRLADELAGRIATRATQAGTPTFAAPALPFGVADYFAGVPGGMAISAAALRAALADLLENLRRDGLTRVVILNGHGGNAPVIHEVTMALKQAHGQVVPSFYLWKIARVLMGRAAPEASFGHGAEPLASLARALRPDFAAEAPARGRDGGRILGLEVSGFGTADFEGLPVDVPTGFAEVLDTAIHAVRPDAELGARIAEELVAVAARFVGHFAAAS